MVALEYYSALYVGTRVRYSSGGTPVLCVCCAKTNIESPEAQVLACEVLVPWSHKAVCVTMPDELLEH